MQAVDHLIRTRLHSDVALVNQIGEYIVGGGGKRLRPALLLLFAGALGYQQREPQGSRHQLLAAVVEFIHTATLLHDDVVDESTLRRGRGTANAMFGNAASVLVGDFLYSRAFQMMVDAGEMRIMQVLADATNTIAEGEVLQLMNCHDPDVDQARYLQVICYKTGKLFEAAAKLGAILCGANADIEERSAEFGQRIGTAFQLIDDVLDYSGVTDDIGKNVGDDLREGKPTLPLIAVLERGSDDDKALVRAAIENGDASKFNDVMAAIHRTDALTTTRQMAENEAAQAAALISPFPDTPFKQALLTLAHFAVHRNN